MSRKQIKVRYCVNDEEKKVILINVGSTVSDFLDNAKEQEDNPDICAAYIRGRKLDYDDLVQNYIKSNDDIIIISDDPDKTAEDFIDIDFIESGKAGDINESMNQSKRDASFLPSSVFKKKNIFKIYTTANTESFFNGDDMTIMNTDTLEIITEKVKNLVQSFDSEIPEDFSVHIFLPGGVPFLKGKIKDYFESIEVTHNRLYVVISKEIDPSFLNEEVKEPCNCSKKYRNILSPLNKSTESGLTKISCFLGYIYHHGIYAEHILQLLAKLTRFAPLITNYFRLLENAPLTNLNIIAITGPLYIYFKSLIPSVKPEKVFEYTLKTFTSIGLLSDVEYLHIHTVDLDNDDDDNENDEDLIKYLRKTKQQNHVVIWECDTAFPDFKGFNLLEIEFDKIDKIFDAVSTFKPIPPLSLHYIYYPTFIAADADNKNVMLFLREVADKKKFIKFIDPKVGKVQIENIEKLAKTLNFGNKIENVMDLVDQINVQQITFICFDQSVSMKYKLEGGRPTNGEKSRAEISSDFLRALIEQSYKFRVSSLYGLISFDSEVKVLQELTPMSSEFIEKLKKIKPHDKTHLWDAIEVARCRMIELLRSSLDEEDEEEDDSEVLFPNAQLRIIVITDGNDNKSHTNPVRLVNDLIQYNIIVDTIMVSFFETNRDCCALSKLTGGLCFRPKSVESGLEIFEQEAFLNITARHLSHKLNDGYEITEEMFKKVSEEFNDNDGFDKFAENQEIINAKSDFPLSTPLFMCYQYHSKDPETIRKKRAIFELNLIGHHPSKSYTVFSSHANPIEWRIFIKGPSGTPFKGKWLNLFMTLPTDYPFSPPKFRFLTVPFHPNISFEGVVSFKMLDVDYSSSVKISEIIDGIIELLKVPEKNYPINPRAMNLFVEDEVKFKEEQSSKEVGVDDFNEFINCKVYDEIPEDVEIPEDTRDSLYMTNATSTKYDGRVFGKSESSTDDEDDDE